MKISPVYIISGEETLLINEALASIESTTLAAGFTDKQRFDQDNSETWARFTLAFQEQSLFAEKTLLICRFSNQKISATAQSTFQAFAKKLPKDKILILLFGKLTAAQQNADWMLSLKKVGQFIPIWPVTIKQFPQWLKQRLTQAGFHVDPTVLELICDYTEGNLLAAKQCIEKCQLFYPPGKLDAEQVMQCLAPAARYTVFDLANALSAKDVVKMNTILQTLRAEGVEPAFVLWAMARECRKQMQIHITPLLQEIDQCVKGIKQASPWPALQRAGFAMLGRPLL